jgi:hypothetical protein
MAKMRSPNYPALNLDQAVGALERLFAAEKRTPVDNNTAALALGFKALSGPARVAIGALRQYGLIEKTATGTMRVSDLAVRILHGTPEDKRAALSEAALTPPLFQELYADRADGSEGAIASYLVTKKEFHPDGARKAARAFRETMALAGGSASGYNGSRVAEEPEDTVAQEQVQNALDKPVGSGQPGIFSMTVPFSKGSIAVQVRVTGGALRPAHLARVRKYLELAEADWNADAEDAE